ncbi:hypothetical protein FCM35_KLT02935 [Carex littledalei]|uniref:Uncharacterized protein n=1 Tax=Carex littledalei TaxID=544730 RepID=A0A833VR02_9POAL|nr:hypothetical protein FCM35_KLT02935 [Carex littledalei]
MGMVLKGDLVLADKLLTTGKLKKRDNGKIERRSAEMDGGKQNREKRDREGNRSCADGERRAKEGGGKFWKNQQPWKMAHLGTATEREEDSGFRV